MAKNKPSTATARFARWRGWVQAAFLLVWLDPLMLRMHTVCGQVFHCYSCPLALFGCPIGVLANFSALHVFPFAALGMLIAVGALVGSLVCGWACPFGFLQDLIAKIPTPKFTLPAWTGCFRYGALVAFVLAVPYLWGESHPLFICRLCPAGAIEAALPNTAQLAMAGEPLVWPTATKLTIVAVFVVAALFTWRPWCMLFCPLGAIYSLLNHVSVVFLRFHGDRCHGCTSCRSLCRAGSNAKHRLDGLRCVRCMECTGCQSVTVATILAPSEDAVGD